jgi:hypothetical protein
MFKLIGFVFVSLFAASVAFAQAPSAPKSPPAASAASGCAAKAIGKDGKPLVGAARASFMRKCEAEADAEDDSLSRQRGSRRR